MEFLEKHNIKPISILKITGLIFLVLIMLSLAIGLVNATLGRSLKLGLSGSLSDSSFQKGISFDQPNNSMELSARNIMPEQDGTTSGDTAEDYEITQYNASIETRNLDQTCQEISSLKEKDYVIFENANEHDRGCNYAFKVKKDKQAEILSVVESLDPKNLVENTRTIKKIVDDYTSEMDILNRKKDSIESTLEDAINSYDEISRVATQARDAESLAKIIDSKVRIIEKLSQERININTQLDRLARQKSEQLDRLAYTYFNINIYENKFIDGEQLKDSWKFEIKQFVRDVNKVLQDSSIGLATLIFVILQYSLYLLIIFLAIKIAWKIAIKIWKK